MDLGGQFANCFANQHGSHRQPAGDRFGQADQIGLQAIMLEGKHPPGAAKPGLDFIDDQQRAPFAADRLRPMQIFGLPGVTPPSPCTTSRITAAVCFIDRVLQRLQVVIRDMGKTGNQRLKRLAVFFFPGGGKAPIVRP